MLNSKHQATYDKIDNQRLQEMCQLVLQQFNSCMFYTASSDYEPSRQPRTAPLASLSDVLVFKLTLVVLMTIEQLKLKKMSAGQQNVPRPQLNVYFTFVAFALVFFSHLVNHTIIRLEEVLMSNHTSRILEKVKINDDEVKDDAVDEEINDKKTKKMEKLRKRQHKGKKEAPGENDESEDEKKTSKMLKKNLRLIYGHRRRKHNSDSDTNEDDDESSVSGGSEDDSKVFDEYEEAESEDEENEENEENEEVKKERTKSDKYKRRLNVAKFIERENLSETEMNEADLSLSHSSTDTSSSDSDSESSSNEVSSSSSSSTEATPAPAPATEAKAATTSQLTTKAAKTNEPESNEYQSTFTNINTANNLFNFKELSVQLLSNFSTLIHQQTGFPTPSLSAPDEFIDNEIYKLVLNGGQAPGFFEIKEAFENEELGKKIATFQIETDSEASEVTTKKKK